MGQGLLEKLRAELRDNGDENIRRGTSRFFREEVRLYGLKTAAVRGIAGNYYREIRAVGKAGVFRLCEDLWRTGYMEESFIACDWSYRMRKEYEPGDFQVFERWVNTYVTNWASCDTLCNHTVGAFVEMYPDRLEDLKGWALSANRWVRRASAVSLIVPARAGRFVSHVFDIAGILLRDRDDMVQKGYGWMLKAASQAHERDVFDWVMRNKADMPRTALRYAIEKMPRELKAAAMAKGTATE